ncbi:MAG TPA: MAPEG family protein [Gammaproteobacteria bacterium]|jgi:hypothetical protein
MQQTAIFGPVIALVVLTLAVLGYTGYKRFGAVFAGRVKGADFRYGETGNVPPDVAVANRNFMNLLEAPVLFYVLCLSLHATGHVTAVTLSLAWAYVGFRALHSAIHLAYNRTLFRFSAYAASNVVLAGLWLWFAGVLFG